jgi:hypothetical protein
MSKTESNRIVHCEDAIQWLQSCGTLQGCSLIASLPDLSEFPGLSLTQWSEWFTAAATLILSKSPDDGVVIFYQSDIKVDGAWIDKAYLCQKAAEQSGHAQLWHKIACRAPPGSATIGRPLYSHVLCFSRGLRETDRAAATADVIADIGEKTWARGMGLKICSMIAKYIARHTPSHTIVNPFCGEGAMLAAANAWGLRAIGIERSPKRAERALGQTLTAGLTP